MTATYQVKVVTSYQTVYTNPIKLRQGERVQIGRQDEQYPGWIWTTTQAGNSGWAPLQLLHKEGETAVVTTDYAATELDTEAGEPLTIMRELNGWLWASNRRGRQGWIPAETVQRV